MNLSSRINEEDFSIFYTFDLDFEFFRDVFEVWEVFKFVAHSVGGGGGGEMSVCNRWGK